MKRTLYLTLPLVVFLSVCVFLFYGLYSDPRERESTVLERPFPAFSLPDLMDENIQYDNSIFDGQLTLINVWGVWCVTCAIERLLRSFKQARLSNFRFDTTKTRSNLWY